MAASAKEEEPNLFRSFNSKLKLAECEWLTNVCPSVKCTPTHFTNLRCNDRVSLSFSPPFTARFLFHPSLGIEMMKSYAHSASILHHKSKMARPFLIREVSLFTASRIGALYMLVYTMQGKNTKLSTHTRG